MFRSIAVQSLQTDTSIKSTCVLRGLEHQCLLFACSEYVIRSWRWDGERPAACSELQSFERLLHIETLDGGGDSSLVVFSANLDVSLYAFSASGAGLVCTQTARLAVADNAHLLPEPVFSKLYKMSATCSVMAVSLYEGVVQLVQFTRSSKGLDIQASSHQLENLVSGEAGTSFVVESLAVVLETAPGYHDHYSVVVLYTAYGAGGLGVVKCVACLDAETSGELRVGPWFIRNLHPTSRVLHTLGSCGPGCTGGIVIASSTGLLFVPAQAPHEKRVIQGSLAGLPTAVTSVGSESRLVVGDSLGHLYVMDLEDKARQAQDPLQFTKVQLSARIAAPSCLAFLQDWSAGNAAPGLVFVGSTVGSSAFVEVQWDVQLPTYSSPSETVTHDPLHWEVLSPDVAGLDSLAPVRNATLIPSPSGCCDEELLMICGTEASGRLELARWAARLVPLVSGGPHLPGQARLLPVKEAVRSRQHRYLLFSFDADHSTSVLDISGTHFQQTTIPGLCLDQATLACQSMMGGYLLQVTPQGAFVIKPATGEVVSTWRCPVALASIHGQYVALASGPEVHCVHVSGATGKLHFEKSLRFAQQVSAVTFFEQASAVGTDGVQATGELWIAAGQWMSNMLVLQHLSAGAPSFQLSLGDKQPRSIAACSFACRQYLFVGSSTGELLWWEAKSSLGKAAEVSIILEPVGWARVGSAPVDLHISTAGAPNQAPSVLADKDTGTDKPVQQLHLLAKSDSLLVVGAAPDLAAQLPFPPNLPLAVRRVHGGQNLRDICPVATAELLPHSFAWVNSSGELQFGQLDAAPAIRHGSVHLDATPSLQAYHSASQCAAVACCEAGGYYSLRLINVMEMVEVARLPLAKQHSVTAIYMASLPCSSAANVEGKPGCKEFLLVASCLDGCEAQISGTTKAKQHGQNGEAEDAAGGVGGGDGSNPAWWYGQAGEWQNASFGNDGPHLQDVASLSSLHGLLSVFEIRRRVDSSDTVVLLPNSKPSYELVLHGTSPLSTVVYSMATVIPATVPFSAASSSAQEPVESDPSQAPMLLAGSHDGVRLYRIFVDDSDKEAMHEVEQCLQSITLVEPLQFEESSTSQGSLLRQSAGSAKASSAPDSEARRLWHQRVAMQLISKVHTYSEGIPSSLCVKGSTVYCIELLSSVSVYNVQPAAPGQLPTLIPCSMDLSGSHVAAILPLSSQHVLAGMRPHGMALLQRNLRAENDMHLEAKKTFGQQLEGGRLRNEEHIDARDPANSHTRNNRTSKLLFVPRVSDCAELEVLAACTQPASMAAICLGQLGAQVCCLQSSEESMQVNLSSNYLSHSLACCPSVVTVSANGAVGSLAVVQDEQFQHLSQLQHALEQKEHQTSVRGTLGKDHRAAWKWSPAVKDVDDTYGGNCIDVTFVRAFLQQFPRLAVAAEHIGQPLKEILNGVGLLQGFL